MTANDAAPRVRAWSRALARALTRGWWGGFVVGLVGTCAAVVLLVAAGRIDAIGHVAWALVVASAAAWCWALPCAAIVAAMPGLSPLRPSPPVATRLAAILGLVAVEIGVAIAGAHFARHHDRSVAIGIVALGVVAATIGAVVGMRARPTMLARALPVASWLPAAVPLAIWFTLPGHVRAHAIVGWALFASAALPYASQVGRPSAWSRRLAVHTAGLAALVATATGFASFPGVAAALLDGHAPVRWLVAAGARATDFDRDGASAYFGGRDCAPRDPQRRAGADEIAGNGVDDNCLAGDLLDDAEVVATLADDGAQTSATNVLIVSVDALRSDRMSIYGYERPTTPRIAEAFADAIRFDRAYAEAASTRDTLPSMLSGRRLAELPWHRDKAVVLDPRTRTIAHAAADRGVQTFAVVPFVALNMLGSTDLGFADTEIYDEKPDATAASVTRRVLAKIDGAGEPFFGFVHYYEPHEPYRPHLRQRRVSDEPYDQEVASVDDAIGVLVAGLRSRGLLDRTILVLTSDHGEAFGEHGHRFHNEGVYEEDLRVPWLLRVPGQTSAVVGAPVSTTALVATLCDLLGWPLPADPAPTVGSVWPLVLGRAEAAPVLASARVGLDRERLALVEGDRKILFDRELASFEVFDLASDPGETGSLADVPSAFVDERVAAAADVLERVFGAAASRRRRAASLTAVPAKAVAPPSPPPEPSIVGAWAELSRAVDGSGLPPRVLVHTIVDARYRGPLEVALQDGETVAQRSSRAIAPATDGAPLVEDVRTFKVYVEDVAQHVVLRMGEWSWSLGPVGALPVGGR